MIDDFACYLNRFRPRFTECSEKIIGYLKLLDDLEQLRTEKYSEARHEKELLAVSLSLFHLSVGVRVYCRFPTRKDQLTFLLCEENYFRARRFDKEWACSVPTDWLVVAANQMLDILNVFSLRVDLRMQHHA